MFSGFHTALIFYQGSETFGASLTHKYKMVHGVFGPHSLTLLRRCMGVFKKNWRGGAFFLTSSVLMLQKHYLYQNGVEFHQKVLGVGAIFNFLNT